MIIEVDPAELSVAEQICAVSQAAYTLEATLIGCPDFPPLRESLEDLQRSPDGFLAFQHSGRIVGILAFDRDSDPVVIKRLAVAPTHLRQGIATALVAELERRLNARSQIVVFTAQANAPAVSFYQRRGFTTIGASNSVEGIPLLHLNKSRNVLDLPEVDDSFIPG